MTTAPPYHLELFPLFICITVSTTFEESYSCCESFKISGHLLFRDSSDPVVAGNCPKLVKSGQWRIQWMSRNCNLRSEKSWVYITKADQVWVFPSPTLFHPREHIKMDLSWKSFLAMPSQLVFFWIQSTFDILPSNLFRWKISSDSRCTFCNTPSASVSHVLSGCKVALVQG